MSTKKLLAIGAGIAVVASAALVVPSIAFGVTPTVLSPAGYVAEIANEADDGPGNNGKGNAFGHDKDSDDFPGKGNGNDQNGDGPGNNGKGNAFGHDKDSEDLPGKGNERDDDGNGPGNGGKPDGSGKHEDGPGNNGKGNAFGHDKDSEDFPGNNGKGNGDDSEGDDD
ncbi:hypothetical protein ASD56_08000 [Microbacterium sp. Root166]|uniref:hypothetical protein n=1 Tax=Microbacterium sp. Root166 TaxID=1736478 RepID=UPI0006F65526|nr:hypothetical protein [Microbacterium sp. Root166]KQZ83964.1 hypothetical protein ASD56_08000 [Microbacterium sp. Root166]